MNAAVLTVSDRSARGERADEGGPLCERLLGSMGFAIAARALVPDERDAIAKQIAEWADAGVAELIVTTGGTGLGPRDVTPEATREVIEREAAGIAEAMRAGGARSTPFAYLSRQVCGTRGAALVVNLPGSPKAIEECVEAIRDILPHAVEMMR